MLEKFNEKVLDQVYKLQQKRRTQIEETGVAVALESADSSRASLKCLREGSLFYFPEGSAVKPGDVLRPVDSIPVYLVTSTEPEAGRIKCETLELPTAFSLFQKHSKGLNMFSQPIYGIRSTRWNNIPCTNSNKDTVKVPKVYTPDNGELLLIGSVYYEVVSTSVSGPVATATVREF